MVINFLLNVFGGKQICSMDLSIRLQWKIAYTLYLVKCHLSTICKKRSMYCSQNRNCKPAGILPKVIVARIIRITWDQLSKPTGTMISKAWENEKCWISMEDRASFFLDMTISSYGTLYSKIKISFLRRIRLKVIDSQPNGLFSRTIA